jgi:predicted amidophosphoribosyltransferase
MRQHAPVPARVRSGSSRLRRVTFCRVCRSELPLDALVCHACGARMPDHALLNRGRIRLGGLDS